MITINKDRVRTLASKLGKALDGAEAGDAGLAMGVNLAGCALQVAGEGSVAKRADAACKYIDAIAATARKRVKQIIEAEGEQQ